METPIHCICAVGSGQNQPAKRGNRLPAALPGHTEHALRWPELRGPADAGRAAQADRVRLYRGGRWFSGSGSGQPVV